MLDLPSPLDINLFKYNKSKFNIVEFINYSFQKLYNDFYKEKVRYEGTEVWLDKKLLDCINCGFKCNNTEYFTCVNCPYKGKLDRFQHITSTQDEDLELTKEYLQNCIKKEKEPNKRTPGVFNKNRTSKIPWIKVIIENANNEENPIQTYEHTIKENDNFKKNAILILYEEIDFMIILHRHINIRKNTQIIYLITIYDKVSDSKKRLFKHKTETPRKVST